MSAWKTMESAPRDGTAFLAIEGSDGYYVCHWGTVYLSHRTDDGARTAKSWVPVPPMPGAEIVPTHWMPLPAPPQSSESNARIVAGPEKVE